MGTCRLLVKIWCVILLSLWPHGIFQMPAAQITVDKYNKLKFFNTVLKLREMLLLPTRLEITSVEA